jgi:hypothetical protein
MFRKSILTIVIAALVLGCGLLFAADGTWWNYVKSLGYLVGALLVFWGLLAIANQFKITGGSFSLPVWLDIIAGSASPPVPLGEDGKPKPGYEANRIAMAIVIAGFLLFAGMLLAPFVKPF